MGLLYDCCERLLEVTVDALDTLPALAPSRQFICDGDPMTLAGDCEFVAVAMSTNSLFPAINVRARGPSLPARPTMKTSTSQGVFGIWFTRICFPTQTDDGDLPDVAEITAASETVLDDRWAVWAALRDEARNGTLFDGILGGNDCAAVEPPASVLGPTGGTAGTVMYVSADLLAVPAAS